MTNREIIERVREAVYSSIPDHDDAEFLTSCIVAEVIQQLPRYIVECLRKRDVHPRIAEQCAYFVFHGLFQTENSLEHRRCPIANYLVNHEEVE